MTTPNLPQTQALDPWETDDWETSEERGLDHAYDQDEWTVKYPPTKNPLRPADLDIRKKREVFLTHLAMDGSPQRAAQNAGLGYRALRLAYNKYPDFAEQWELAKIIYAEFVAEDEVRRRAIEGYVKDVWYKGNPVGSEIQYDSGLTIAWLKANLREKYTERKETKIEGSLNFGIALLPARGQNIEEWERNALDMHAGQTIIDITPNKSETVEAPKKNSGTTISR